MKIAFVLNSLGLGGGERQALYDIQIFLEQGYDVSLFYYKDGDLKDLLPQKVDLIKTSRYNYLLAAWHLFKIVNHRKYDVVIAHLYWSALVSALATFLTNSKLIIFDHGLGLWRKWYHIIPYWLAAKLARKVVTVSSKSRYYKKQREKIHEKKLMIVPNCYLPQTKNESTDKSEHKLSNINDNTFVICFSGRFVNVKQLNHIVEFAKYLKPKHSKFQFLLLGDGPEMKSIKHLIKQENMEELFTFTGYVGNPNLLLKTSDLFILPSIREDLSMSLIEAAYAGIPQIAYDVGGNKDVIYEGETGYLIHPFDKKAFGDAIAYLMENPELRKKMGNSAHQKALKVFSPEKRKETIVKILRDA